MTSASTLQVAPIPVSLENGGEWSAIAAQIASEAGLPTQVTPEMLTGMVASAVALMFKADVSKDASILRGTFAETVVAQCQRNAGCLRAQQPLSASLNLVGVHVVEGHPALRVHLNVHVREVDGSECVNGQFWDIQLGGQVTVGDAQCPNCGAPIPEGQLICPHCQSDVRSVVGVPLVVTRLELY